MFGAVSAGAIFLAVRSETCARIPTGRFFVERFGCCGMIDREQSKQACNETLGRVSLWNYIRSIIGREDSKAQLLTHGGAYVQWEIARR